MLLRAKALKSFALDALDGKIGKVNHLYFDDESWVVRYFVVDSGKRDDPTDNWFFGRQILLPPSKVTSLSVEEQLVATNLLRKEIEDSPGTMTDRPVSQQSEEGNYNALGWPVAWYGPDHPIKPQDPHLRSTAEVTGYHFQASDGEIGHVADFVIDVDTWTIRYLILDTRNWWPGKQVLISPRWIEKVSWEESKVSIVVTREQVKQAPAFDDELNLTRAYEAQLFQYYQQKQYWND